MEYQKDTKTTINKNLKTPLNSPFTYAEQPKICSKYNQHQITKQNMETSSHNTDILFDEDLYTVEWSDIENAEMDYENYLNDIENFFRQDFEEDILEEDTF
ncbi:hypothetical protein EG339_06490 [Chryseobacterium bernardetii]|uniref:Uncharacterized protein n=2 Tax=Chryseobacterium bernardetii TaxID=1241978 RepID=A0A3G6T4J1_9FLAO|nr:hypothetical protein EG339_06490 [Chryseobacterium bernardetii]